MAYFSAPKQQYLLNLEVSQPHGSLDYWVKKLHENTLCRSVMASDAFKRLKKISFLGAIDYLPYESYLKKAPRTRAEHSLHVAALAYFVAEHRGYNEELTRHLIVAGLLHDIGHPPLSHSVEPYLKQHFGFGHHEMGQMLLKGEQRVGKRLSRILQAELDVDFIDQLIAGAASPGVGGDLFSSPINIDTIDGILRTLGYSKAARHVSPLDVAYASFIQTDEKRFWLLDEFWKLKGLAYTNVINRREGVLADQYSQSYFYNESGVTLDEESLFDDEIKWGKKFTPLFDSLKSLKEEACFLNDMIDVVDRNYYVADSNNVFERFRSNKTRKKVSVDTLNYHNNAFSVHQACMID